jgi:hypothetical protein
MIAFYAHENPTPGEFLITFEQLAGVFAARGAIIFAVLRVL